MKNNKDEVIKKDDFGKLDEVVEVLVEVSKGSRNKYEMDHSSGKLVLDRVISLPFPANYGEMVEAEDRQKTLARDGDPLDIVLMGDPIDVGCVVKARLVGIMCMQDGGVWDNKLIAVPANNPAWNNVRDLKDLGRTTDELFFFFNNYKDIGRFESRTGTPEKIINIVGLGDKREAYQILNENRQLYQKYKKYIVKGIPKEELVIILNEKREG